MPQLIDDAIREQTDLLTAELQRIAIRVDLLLEDSLAAGSGQTMALGEASQGVHRALLALSLQRLSAEMVVDVREWVPPLGPLDPGGSLTSP
ncbi:MAG TPA: hypothetical protein VLX59_07340 [Acidimicrobiales bacterium]|nr:hypothetical protein [Acidimicrobiales bacterium]